MRSSKSSLAISCKLLVSVTDDAARRCARRRRPVHSGSPRRRSESARRASAPSPRETYPSGSTSVGVIGRGSASNSSCHRRAMAASRPPRRAVELGGIAEVAALGPHRGEERRRSSSHPQRPRTRRKRRRCSNGPAAPPGGGAGRARSARGSSRPRPRARGGVALDGSPAAGIAVSCWIARHSISWRRRREHVGPRWRAPRTGS